MVDDDIAVERVGVCALPHRYIGESYSGEAVEVVVCILEMRIVEEFSALDSGIGGKQILAEMQMVIINEIVIFILQSIIVITVGRSVRDEVHCAYSVRAVSGGKMSSVSLQHFHLHGYIHFGAVESCVGSKLYVFLGESEVAIVAQFCGYALALIIESIDVESIAAVQQ